MTSLVRIKCTLSAFFFLSRFMMVEFYTSTCSAQWRRTDGESQSWFIIFGNKNCWIFCLQGSSGSTVTEYTVRVPKWVTYMLDNILTYKHSPWSPSRLHYQLNLNYLFYKKVFISLQAWWVVLCSYKFVKENLEGIFEESSSNSFSFCISCTNLLVVFYTNAELPLQISIERKWQ